MRGRVGCVDDLLARNGKSNVVLVYSYREMTSPRLVTVGE